MANEPSGSANVTNPAPTEREPVPSFLEDRQDEERAGAGQVVPRFRGRDDRDAYWKRQLELVGARGGRSTSPYARTNRVWDDDFNGDRPRSRERSSKRPYRSPDRSPVRGSKRYYGDEDYPHDRPPYSPPPPPPSRSRQPPPQQPQPQAFFYPAPPANIVINNYQHSADSSEDEHPGDNDGAIDKQRRHQRKHSNGKRSHDDDARHARQPRSMSAPQDARIGQSASNAQTVLSRKGVNAIWDPSQNSDITIHLKLPLREEGLDEQIEEFGRLRRLGDFASARQFFTEELEDHHDNPYLLVQYAEMLLEQGDYITLSGLNGHAAFAPDNHLLHNPEGKLLRMYWNLLQLVRSLDSPPTDWGLLNVIPEALRTLHDTVGSGESPVGSTQIKVLAVILGLAGIKDNVFLQTSWLRRQLTRLFPETFYRRLYADLLRDGRIWDFHDIFISKVWAEGFKEAIHSFVGLPECRKPLNTLLADWRSPVGDSDGSTTLALLDLLLSVSPISASDRDRIYDIEEDTMALATQIATSVMGSHPKLMESQPFLYWMLRKSGNALLQGGSQQQLFYDHLQSQPGISASFRSNPIPGIYHHRGFGLPEYTPVGHENPGWRQDDAPAEYQAPAELVLKQAKRLENYRLQSQALTNLILFSKSPAKLFGELCALQKSVQGDIKRYSHTLGSSYLALGADDSPMDELKLAIREIFYDPESCLTTHEKWYQGLLLYSMESDVVDAERVLETAFDNSRYLSKAALELLDAKMPDLRLRRMEYLENNISSDTERRQAEKGICPSLRLREAMELPEFPELEMEERPTTVESPKGVEAAGHGTNESPNPKDGTPVQDTENNNNNENHSGAAPQQVQEQPRRQHRRRERARAADEWAVLREKEYEKNLDLRETNMGLREVRHQLKEFNPRQETEETLAKRLSEERHRLEMDSLREEVREMQRQRERAEMEEQLKRAQTKVEEMQQEEREKTQRDKVWREALERYRRDTAARRTHEDLMRELREVRGEIAEVKSAMKPREQEPPFHRPYAGPDLGRTPPRDIRIPVVNRAGRRRYHHAPPRIIQVDHLPSSPSSSQSPIAEAGDPGFGDTAPFGGEVGDRSPGCEKEEGACHGNVEELDDSDEPADAQEIYLEARTMNHREENLGE